MRCVVHEKLAEPTELSFMSSKNIVFIDSRVAGYKSTIDSVRDPAEVFILNGESDGLTQMAGYLKGRSGIEAIHVISHGSQGALYLGSTVLDDKNLAAHQPQLTSMGASLTQTGDILLYGCDVAQGDVGVQFIASLAQVTGADLAASDDLTGGHSGDLVLEVSSGNIESATMAVAINAPLLMYSNARHHLDQFVRIDFSKISASDLSAIAPLTLAKLNSNNLFDQDIGIYGFLEDIERMAQIQDELFLATNDVNALFAYMKVADPSYYQSMLNLEASTQSSIDNALRNAAPDGWGLLWDITVINFSQAWEGFSGVGNALVDAFEAGAGGIGKIYNNLASRLTNTLPSSFAFLADGKGGFYVLSGEAFQSLANLYENTNSLIKNFSDFSTKNSFSVNLQIATDSIALVAKITDDALQFKEALSGVGISDSNNNGLMTAAKVLSLGINLQNWLKEMGDILTAANDASSLTGMSKEFLNNAVWINRLEGFDLAKDLVSVLLPLVKNPMHEAITAYLTEALVTLTDVVAIAGKNEWKSQVDQFNDYEGLGSIVNTYRSNLSNWIAHADSLSGGTWGANIASNLPVGPLPINDAFASRYDGLLENEPGASGKTLALGSSYDGAISFGDPGDWFVVNLTAGQDYRFAMEGTSLTRTDLTLYSADGFLRARVNSALSDSNTSVIEGTAPKTGVYFLVAASSSTGYYGSYTVNINTANLPATLDELQDAPATTATPYRIAVGETFHGNMNYADKDYASDDWIAVSLVAGQNYRVQLTWDTFSGLSHGDVTIYDSLSRIFANYDRFNSTSATSFDEFTIEGTALSSGTYYIAVDSNGKTGGYTVSFNTVNLPDTFTELQDAPNTTTTPYRIGVGETFHGDIGGNFSDKGYSDWIAISLIAGQHYRVQLTWDTFSSLAHDFVTLHDANGNIFANANAALTQTTSAIEGTALISGTYYIAVDGDGLWDGYTLSFTSTTASDTTAPTIIISAGDPSLSMGETSTITFTLSEASTNFVASDVTVTGGSLSNFSGNGTSYTATFTPTANSTANGVVKVASSKFTDAAGNANTDGLDANNTLTLQVDTQNPTVSTFSPADESTGVGIFSNIVVTFSEAIARGVGNVVLKTAAGATVASYDAVASANLSISGSTLTINPSADLGFSSGYRLEFAAGSIKDLAGNSYAGTNSYNFTTAAASNQSPVVATAMQDQDWIERASLYYIVPSETFSDPDGNTLSYSATLSSGASLPSWLSFNSTTRTFSGTAPASSPDYTVRVTATDGGNLGISDDVVFFTVSSATNRAPVVAAAMQDQDWTEGASLYYIVPSGTFFDPDGNTLSYSATLSGGASLPSWLSFNSTTRTFSGTAPASSPDYTVRVTATDSGNLSASDDVDFYTVAGITGPDNTPPTVTTFTPADEASGVAVASNVFVTFSEPITRGTGNILLKTAAGVTVATLDAATSSNLSIAGNTLTINPTADLAFSTGYRVEFAAGSIKDLAGNAFTGTTSYNFTTVADTASQTFTGTADADSFTSRLGNDTIDGGAGIDTAVFNGSLSNYTLTKSGSTYTVQAKTGTDGTDTLLNVESLRFTDVTVNLQVKGIAAAAPLTDVQRISELYVAFFNRTPDADGLAYWIGQKMAGQSINQISEAFYNVGASSTFSALTGFSTSMTNEDFLNVFYKNVLGRPEGADAGGLAYWNGKLADGSSTRSSLANDILDSAHTFKGNPTWGWVADLLDNKIAVANTIAVEWGLTYNTDAYTRGVAIAAAITPTDTAAAMALVGVSAVDFNIA